MTDGMIDPNDCGHWDGDRFVFDPPLTLFDADGGVHVMQQLDFTHMVLQGGLSRDDILHAMVNAVHVETITFNPRDN